MRTLVVEDDPTARHLLTKVLRGFGHEVTACPDAEAAWETYQAAHYELLVVDWVLPGMDGLELCRRVRGSPGGDRSVILVVTVRDAAEDLEAVLAAGADDFLAKPIDVGLLKVRLAIAEQGARVRARQKEVEEALLRSEQRYRRLTGAVTDYIFTVRVEDGRTVETQHSTACEAVTGYATEDFAANPYLWIHMVHDDDRDAVRDQAARVLAGDLDPGRHLPRVADPERCGAEERPGKDTLRR